MAPGSEFQLYDELDNKNLFTGHVADPRDLARPTERHILVVTDRWGVLERGTMIDETPWGFDTRVLLGGEYREKTKAWDPSSEPGSEAEVLEIDGIEIVPKSLEETIRKILGSDASLGSPQINLTGRMFPQFSENVTRAQAILQVLRWSRGALGWFDHNGRFRATSDPETATVHSSGCSSIDLTERLEQRISSFTIYLRKERQSNFASERNENISYTATSGSDGVKLAATIDLTPERFSLSDGSVKLREAKPESLDWWLKVHPDLDAIKDQSWFQGPLGSAIRSWRIKPDGELVLDASIRHEVVGGGIADTWRDYGASGPHSAGARILTSGNSKKFVTGKLKAVATFRVSPTQVKTYDYECEACNQGSSGRYVYEEKGEYDAGEQASEFADLPGSFLGGMPGRQWQGKLDLLPRDDRSIRNPPIGKRLYLLGWRSDSADFDSRITQVTVDLFIERPTYTVGPPPDLVFTDLVEQMRAFRDGVKRPPGFVTKESGRPPSDSRPQGRPSPATTQNSAATTRELSTQGFALNGTTNAEITVVPSEVWDFVPQGMNATSGQDFSVGSSGAMWIRIQNGGKARTDFTIQTASEYLQTVPAGETHYKLGSWVRVIDQSSGLLVLRITQLRYGPIDRPGGAAVSNGPWSITTRVKPGSGETPSYEFSVVPGILRRSRTPGDVVDNDDIVDLYDSAGGPKWADVPGTLPCPVWLELTFEEEAGELSDDPFPTIKSGSEFDPEAMPWTEGSWLEYSDVENEPRYHTLSRRLLGTIESGENSGDPPTVRNETSGPLTIVAMTVDLRPAQFPVVS